MVYYGNQQQLEHDFVVRPGAYPGNIRLRFPGASSVKLTSNGDLQIGSSGQSVVLRKPVVYQEVNGSKHEIAAEYALTRGTASFRISKYDHSKTLIIDSVLAFRFSIGGFGSQILGVAVDSGGLAYVTGETEGFGFTPVHGEQPTFGGGLSDAFVAKINPWFSTVLYSTFLGGSGTDVGNSIAVDGSQNAYVTGFTESPNFPLKNAAQTIPGGGFSDAFDSKFTSTGALAYSTFLGGSGQDQGDGIAVDSKHNAYITGFTSSSNFPTRNPLQPSLGNPNCTFCTDAFVTKLNSSGAFVYSTYLGGSMNDVGNAIAVDSTGAAYITGYTNSTNFPTMAPLQANLATSTRGGSLFGADAFISKLNAAGSALVYSTYFGGDGDDSGNGIAVDSAGNAYIAGTTGSDNLKTVNPLTSKFTNGCPTGFVGDCGADGMVLKLNSTGSALVYSTYLAGRNGLTQATGVAIDSGGDAFVTGALAGLTGRP